MDDHQKGVLNTVSTQTISLASVSAPNSFASRVLNATPSGYLCLRNARLGNGHCAVSDIIFESGIHNSFKVAALVQGYPLSSA
jgi:hypothetical protein